MIRKDLLSGSKWLLLLLLLSITSFSASAQRRPPNPLESFLDTQFWLGLRVGMNYTQANPDMRNTGFSPINYASDSLEKNYSDFTRPGAHMGLEMNLYHRGFSASFQPAFKRSNYEYESSLKWQGATANSRFETTYQVEQNLDIIELPILLKYDFIRHGEIRPFIMIGGFHSVVVSAQKSIKIAQVDYSAGTPLSSSGGNTSLAVKDAFQNFSGVSAGAGVNLDFWNIRTIFELNYRRALTSVTRPNAQQNELASLGEVNDEVFLRDINASLGFVFPLRFIDQQFKAR